MKKGNRHFYSNAYKRKFVRLSTVYEISRLCDCNSVCVLKFSSSTDGVVAIVQLLSTCSLPILEFSFTTLSDAPQDIKDIVFQQAFYSAVRPAVIRNEILFSQMLSPCVVVKNIDPKIML